MAASIFRPLLGFAAFALAGCGGGETANNFAEPAGNEGQVPVLSEGEGADLANEAAADEAADMELFGGNAAAGEQSGTNNADAADETPPGP